MAPPTGAALGERLARLFAETARKHVAATLPGQMDARRRFLGVVLEELEQATAAELRGLVGALADDPELPPELQGFMRTALQPGGQDKILVTIAAMIGSAFVVTSAAAEPFGRDFNRAANRSRPNAVLSPADAAVAMVKGVWDAGRATQEARESGVDAGRFTTLTRIAGNPPGPGELGVMLRRGIIDRAAFNRGIAQGLTRIEWADELAALRFGPPDASTAVAAVVQNQATAGEGRALAALAGLDPKHFDLAVKVAGTPPGVVEVIELWRRGDATRAEVEQVIRESRTKTKYIPLLLKLRRRLLPADTIASMAGDGTLTAAQAHRLLAEHGYADADATAWIRHHTAAQRAGNRDLAKGEVLALYEARALPRARAEQLLRKLGYDASEAGLLLGLRDTARARRLRDAGAARVGALYVGHHIDRGKAATDLDALHVPGDQRAELLRVWDLERAANVRELTPAQLTQALRRRLLDRRTALRRLEGLGYTAGDAELLLKLSTPAPAR